jgi:hypothetical protein
MLTTAHGEQGSSGQGVVLCWPTALETGPESTALPLHRTHCIHCTETAMRHTLTVKHALYACTKKRAYSMLSFIQLLFVHVQV